MIRKLLRVAGVLGVMGVSACAAPAEEVEPEAVPIGQVKQGYCFGGPGNSTVPRPRRRRLRQSRHIRSLWARSL